MKLESLSKKLNSKIKEILKNENFTNEQISVICNKYFSFDSQKDFTHPKYEHPYFFPIVQQISLGISNLNNIENDVNFKEKTKLFKGYLKRNNLNMNEILSLFDYTRNSDIILKFQRTIKNVENEVQITKDIYLKGIKSYFRNNSENENLNYKKIQLLVEKINFDTSLQDFKNHFNQIFDNLLSSGETPSYIVDITNELFEDLYSIKEKYNTNFSVDSALSAPLPNNVVLYRAISRVSKTIRNLIGNSRDYSSLIGKKIEDKGFTSTSLLYNTSFAMYEDYDIVFKIPNRRCFYLLDYCSSFSFNACSWLGACTYR